jgi:hypothetical protein
MAIFRTRFLSHDGGLLPGLGWTGAISTVHEGWADEVGLRLLHLRRS